MRSGLHGHPAKPIPGGRHEKRASHSTRGDADYDCIRVGEQVTTYALSSWASLVAPGHSGSGFPKGAKHLIIEEPHEEHRPAPRSLALLASDSGRTPKASEII